MVAEDAVADAHNHSIDHRAEIERRDCCGCFYCKQIYAPVEITEWTDEGQTALCPKCGIDAVIGSASGYPIDRTFMQAMNARWF